jgi:hypothetical protein
MPVVLEMHLVQFSRDVLSTTQRCLIYISIKKNNKKKQHNTNKVTTQGA